MKRIKLLPKMANETPLRTAKRFTIWVLQLVAFIVFSALSIAYLGKLGVILVIVVTFVLLIIRIKKSETIWDLIGYPF